MHLELEDINALLGSSLSEEERLPRVEHLLGCRECATHFKMMYALSIQAPVKPARHPLRWAVGAAAVAVLALFPLYRDRHVLENVRNERAALRDAAQAEPLQAAATAAESLSGSVWVVTPPPTLGILQRIAAVEKTVETQAWGQEANVLELIRQQNRKSKS